MKTILFSLAFTFSSLMAFSQNRSFTSVSVSPNTNVGSTNSFSTNVNTNSFHSTRDMSSNHTTTNDYSTNYNNNNATNNNSNNSYSSNNINYNNGYNNNGYYNNGYNNGYYNNGYNNNYNGYNNNYNNNNYNNNNTNRTYTTTDNSFGTQLVTQDKDAIVAEKSPFNISNQFNNYRKNTAIDRLFFNTQKTSQTFIINAQTENTLKGTGGTIVKIAPNSFVNSLGEVVKGDVEFELKEVYQKSEMILSNAHTVSNDVPLVSGGEMYMGATKNGEALVLANNKPIAIQMPATAGTTEAMQLFNGKPDRNTVNWSLANTNSVSPILNSNSTTGQSYNFSTNSMNWINCDRFNRSNSPSTKVTVRVSQQYDTTNTAVFIIFAGQNTVTKFDHFNKLDRTMQSSFDTKWYSVPTGSDVTIVAISEINGQYYSSMQRTKLVKDHQADLIMEPTTLDQFKSNMEKLP